MATTFTASSTDSHKLPLDQTLPNGVSQGLQKAKDFLAETTGKAVNTVSDTTNQAADAVTRTADKTRDFWRESANNTANTMTEAAHRAVDTITTTTEESVNSLSTTTERATGAIDQATDQAVDTAAITARQATDSLAETIAEVSHTLEDTIQKAERLNIATAKSVQGAMNSFIHEWVDSIRLWIDAHPAAFWAVQTMTWAIDHPIFALVIAFLLIFILQRLLKALSYLAEKALIFILQAPFKFGRFLLKASARFLGRLRGKETTSELTALSSELIETDQKERLTRILTRLEAIQQEQNQLLQEVAAIVASDQAVLGVNKSSQTDQPSKALRLLFQGQSKDVKPVPNHNDPALG